MTREETVRNLLTELIDMIDNGSQRDLDRADEIGASIIKLVEQETVIDKVRAQIDSYLRGVEIALEVLDKNHKLRPKMEGALDTLKECLSIIDQAESEDWEVFK